MNSIFKKKLAAAMIAASVITAVPAFALTETETAAINAKVAAVKVVELPSVASKLVAKAAKQDKESVATAVVTAAAKRNPGSTVAVVRAVLKQAPETTKAVVAAASAAAPETASAVAAAAVDVAKDQAKAEKAIAELGKATPSQAIAFERGVAAANSRRLLSANADSGVGVVTEANPYLQGKTVTELPARLGSNDRP